MNLEQADLIHQRAANSTFGWEFKHLVVKAFNAHQHFYSPDHSSPSKSRMDGAAAELRLFSRLRPKVYYSGRH